MTMPGSGRTLSPAAVHSRCGDAPCGVHRRGPPRPGSDTWCVLSTDTCLGPTGSRRSVLERDRRTPRNTTRCGSDRVRCQGSATGPADAHRPASYAEPVPGVFPQLSDGDAATSLATARTRDTPDPRRPEGPTLRAPRRSRFDVLVGALAGQLLQERRHFSLRFDPLVRCCQIGFEPGDLLPTPRHFLAGPILFRAAPLVISQTLESASVALGAPFCDQ